MAVLIKPGNRTAVGANPSAGYEVDNEQFVAPAQPAPAPTAPTAPPPPTMPTAPPVEEHAEDTGADTTAAAAAYAAPVPPSLKEEWESALGSATGVVAGSRDAAEQKASGFAAPIEAVPPPHQARRFNAGQLTSGEFRSARGDLIQQQAREDAQVEHQQRIRAAEQQQTEAAEQGAMQQALSTLGTHYGQAMKGKQQAHNAAVEREMDAAGALYEKDEQGNLRWKVDPLTGKPLFRESTGPVEKRADGTAVQRRMDKTGHVTTVDADADAPVVPHPTMPGKLQRQNKHRPVEDIDPEKGLSSADVRVKTLSAKLLHERELEEYKTRRAEVTGKLQEAQLAGGRVLRPEDRQELEGTVKALSVPVPRPEKVTSVWGGAPYEDRAKVTEWEEREAQRERDLAAAQAQLKSSDDVVTLRQQDIDLTEEEKKARAGGVDGFYQRRLAQQAGATDELGLIARFGEVEREQQGLVEAGTALKAELDALDEQAKRGLRGEAAMQYRAQRADKILELQQLDQRLEASGQMAAELVEMQKLRYKQELERRQKAEAEGNAAPGGSAPAVKEGGAAAPVPSLKLLPGGRVGKVVAGQDGRGRPQTREEVAAVPLPGGTGLEVADASRLKDVVAVVGDKDVYLQSEARARAAALRKEAEGVRSWRGGEPAAADARKRKQKLLDEAAMLEAGAPRESQAAIDAMVQKMEAQRTGGPAAGATEKIQTLMERVRAGEIDAATGRQEKAAVVEEMKKAHQANAAETNKTLGDALTKFADGRMSTRQLDALFKAAGVEKSGMEVWREESDRQKKAEDLYGKLRDLNKGTTGNWYYAGFDAESGRPSAEGSAEWKKREDALIAESGVDPGQVEAIRRSAAMEGFRTRVKGGLETAVNTNVWEKLPFVGGFAAAANLYPIVTIGLKFQNDPESVSQEELQQLKAFADEAGRDSTFWAGVVDTLTELPGLGVEVATTGGIASAGKAAAKKAGAEVLKRLVTGGAKAAIEKRLAAHAGERWALGIGERVATGAVGEMARLPAASAGRITEDMLRRQMPQIRFEEGDAGRLKATLQKAGDDGTTALWKAIGNSYAENLSERAGGMINELGGAARDRLAKTALFSALAKVNPGKTAGTLVQYVEKTGYHGVVSEMAEERVGDLLRAGMGVEDFELPTINQVAQEFVSFALPGVGRAVSSRWARQMRVTDQDQKIAAGGREYTDYVGRRTPETLATDLTLEARSANPMAAPITPEMVGRATELAGPPGRTSGVREAERAEAAAQEMLHTARGSGDAEALEAAQKGVLEARKAKRTAVMRDISAAVGAVGEIEGMEAQAAALEQQAGQAGAGQEAAALRQQAAEARHQAVRARALVRLASGVPPASLTTEELAGAGLVEDGAGFRAAVGPREAAQNPALLGTLGPVQITAAGEAMITDAARQQLAATMPQAASLIQVDERTARTRAEARRKAAGARPQTKDAGETTWTAQGQNGTETTVKARTADAQEELYAGDLAGAGDAARQPAEPARVANARKVRDTLTRKLEEGVPLKESQKKLLAEAERVLAEESEGAELLSSGERAQGDAGYEGRYSGQRGLPDFRVDERGVHPLAKPRDVGYVSGNDNFRDPAAVLDALVRGDGQPHARSGAAATGDSVRGGEGADTTLPWKHGRPIASHARLYAWAADAGQATSAVRDLATGKSLGSGGEHLVFRVRGNRVLKLTKPGLYGAQAEDAGAYLQRMALSNRVFGDDVKFEGYVTLPGEAEARAVISQPFVEGKPATADQIRDFMGARGFHDLGNYFWVHPVTGVAVWDTLTKGNAIVRKSDGKVVPIDFTVQPATPQQVAEARAQSGRGRATLFAGQGAGSGDAGSGRDVAGAATGQGTGGQPAGAWLRQAADRMAANVEPADRSRMRQVVAAVAAQLDVYSTVFPGGVRYAGLDVGGGMVYNAAARSLTIDLDRVARQVSGVQDVGALVQAMMREEVVHRAATDVLSRAEVEHLWTTLPDGLRKTVRDAYWQDRVQRGDKVPRDDAWAMGHEFLRMLTQDSFFKQVTESAGVARGVIPYLRELLGRIGQRLRELYRVRTGRRGRRCGRWRR